MSSSLSTCLPRNGSSLNSNSNNSNCLTRKLILREYGGLFASKNCFSPFSSHLHQFNGHVVASTLQPRYLPKFYETRFYEDSFPFSVDGQKILPTVCVFGKGIYIFQSFIVSKTIFFFLFHFLFQKFKNSKIKKRIYSLLENPSFLSSNTHAYTHLCIISTHLFCLYFFFFLSRKIH